MGNLLGAQFIDLWYDFDRIRFLSSNAVDWRFFGEFSTRNWGWPIFWGSKPTKISFLGNPLVQFCPEGAQIEPRVKLHQSRYLRLPGKKVDQNCRLWLSGTVYRARLMRSELRQWTARAPAREPRNWLASHGVHRDARAPCELCMRLASPSGPRCSLQSGMPFCTHRIFSF